MASAPIPTCSSSTCARTYWAKDPRRDWITRKEFRQAISHAIDREAFANTVFLGAGVPIWGPITPGNQKWFSPNVPRYGYSVERAKEILAGLGLTNRDADPNGSRMRRAPKRASRVLDLPRQLVGRARRPRSCATTLKPLGIAVDVVLLEQGALIQRMLKGDFEAIIFIQNTTSLDPAMNPDFWLSSGSAHIWNIGQPKPATDWEKQIDDLMRIVMSSVDQAERKKAFDEIQKIFAENLPVLYFVAPRLYMGVSTRVGGVTPSILRPQLLWNVERMTVQAGPVGARMGRYLLTRLGFALVLVFVVSSAALILTRIAPGDFIEQQCVTLSTAGMRRAA